MMELNVTHVDPAVCLTAPAPACGAAVAWLGQAGFLIRAAGLNVVIDPYLSDSLAEKYRGKQFPHTRMMPPPIAPQGLHPIDLVFCTHGHTDHMDAQTLRPIANANPNCQFIIPAAEYGKAVSRGVPTDRMLSVDADDLIRINDQLTIDVLPSAHEEMERDEAGRFRFLGYVLRFPNISIYHSGDTIDYAGLDERLRSRSINLALLPCNGRDEFRRENNVPGNMNIEEAIDLCRRAGIDELLPHHFEMFDFNTADLAELKRRATETSKPRVTIPRIGQVMTWLPETGASGQSNSPQHHAKEAIS